MFLRGARMPQHDRPPGPAWTGGRCRFVLLLACAAAFGLPAAAQSPDLPASCTVEQLVTARRDADLQRRYYQQADQENRRLAGELESCRSAAPTREAVPSALPAEIDLLLQRLSAALLRMAP